VRSAGCRAPELLHQKDGLEEKAGCHSQTEANEAARSIITRVVTVLLLGRELELGHYRAEYLKSQGVHTIFPETKGAATAVIRTGGFEAIIVSYTLSDATVKELMDVIEESCPAIPIIAITKQRWEDHVVRPAEMVMDTDPPQALLEAIHRVQRQKHHGIRQIK
jgi:DNA-binding response OmpR family regulator